MNIFAKQQIQMLGWDVGLVGLFLCLVWFGLVGWVGWVVWLGCLFGCLGCLGCLFGWLVGWLVGWLFCVLVGYFACWMYALIYLMLQSQTTFLRHATHAEKDLGDLRVSLVLV